MRILFAASEVVPLAKTGGLADVAGSLPAALRERGHDVRVVMPAYRRVREAGLDLRDTGDRVQVRVGREILIGKILETEPASGVPVYLIRYDPFFDREYLYGAPGKDYPDNASRFIFFSRAVLDLMRSRDFWPDVLHLNDWQTALAALYLGTYRGIAGYGEVASLLTIHNLAYQGLFWYYDLPLTGLGPEYFTPEGIEFYGKISFLKAGLVFADALSTVSVKYAREIQTPEFGCGLDGVLRKRSRDLFGILNGVAYNTWDPTRDPLIPASYTSEDLRGKGLCKQALLAEFGLDPDPGRPLIGMVSRLTEQKGLDLLEAAAEELMKIGVSFAVVGTGDGKYHDFLRRWARRYSGRVGVKLAYDNRAAHLVEAGADLFLMPSRYEPCGLNQMYSLRYGTIPVVRATGGLDDTVTNFSPRTRRGNGFKFSAYSSGALCAAVRRALAVYRDPELWRSLVANAMACDFSWDRSAQRYERLYARIRGGGAAATARPGAVSGKDRT